MQIDHRRGVLWALCAAACTSGFVIPWKLANSLGGTEVNTLILLISAAVFSSGLIGLRQRAMPRFTGFDVRIAAAMAVLTLAGNLATAEAIVELSPAVLNVVQRSEVIIVALLAWPLIGERFDLRYVIGAAIAVAGLIVLQDPVHSDSAATRGMMMAMIAALCFSSMAVLTRKYVHRFEHVSVNALRLWMAAGLWFVFHSLPEDLSIISGEQAGYACMTAFFGPFLGRLFIMSSAKYVEVRITTLVMLITPPLTLVFSFLVLNDVPSSRQIQGGLIMLAGIAIPALSWARPKALHRAND